MEEINSSSTFFFKLLGLLRQLSFWSGLLTRSNYFRVIDNGFVYFEVVIVSGGLVYRLAFL